MNIRKLLCAVLGLALMAAMAATALAKVPSPGTEFYFLDQAKVLSEETKGEIFFSDQLLNEACGAQIVVVTVNSTGSQAIDDYTYELFNNWGIGDAKAQNGFLLVLSIKDESGYAVCGTNLQSKFTSSTIKEYFDKYLLDDFFAGKYDSAVKSFFEAVFKRVADIYNANVTIADGIAAYEAWSAQGSRSPWKATPGGGSYGKSHAPAEDDSGSSLGIVVFTLVLILIVVMLMGRSRRRRVYGPTFVPIFFGSRRTPPPPPPSPVGAGGYRGTPTGGPMPGAGGYRGATPPPSGGAGRSNVGVGFGAGLLNSLMRSSGSGSSHNSSSRSSSVGRSSGSRSSSSRSSSFGSARGGGGSTRGGGAGFGRH